MTYQKIMIVSYKTHTSGH